MIRTNESYAFSQAVKWNDVQKVKTLIENPRVDVNVADGNGDTPLHYAVALGNEEILRTLFLCQKINVNAQNKYKNTPLHILCEKGYLFYIKKLANHPDIDLNILNRARQTPLIISCVCDYVDVMKFLMVKTNKNINDVDVRGYTLLMHACESGSIDCVKYFINDPAMQMNWQSKFYRDTALTLACKMPNNYKAQQIAGLILGRGDINVMLKNSARKTALKIANDRDFIPIIDLICDYENCFTKAEKEKIVHIPAQNLMDKENLFLIKNYINAKGLIALFKDLSYAHQKILLKAYTTQIRQDAVKKEKISTLVNNQYTLEKQGRER